MAKVSRGSSRHPGWCRRRACEEERRQSPFALCSAASEGKEPRTSVLRAAAEPAVVIATPRDRRHRRAAARSSSSSEVIFEDVDEVNEIDHEKEARLK